MIIRKIRLTEYEYQPPINFVAGATEPDIQFQLTDYTIPAGAEARAYVQRFDGTFEYTVATISGNNVTVAPTSSMFSVKGPGAIQVTLYVGNEVVKNFAVPVYVHADLADDSAEAGSDVTGVFRAAEEQALADFAEDAEAKAAEVIESIPEDYTELTEEVSELNERLESVEDTVEDCFIEQSTSGEQVTLTNGENITAFCDGIAGSGLRFISISSGVATFESWGANNESSPYCLHNLAKGSGTWIVGFKFKFTKVDPQSGDPENFRVIIGASTSTDYEVQWGEWLEYKNVATIDLTRIRISARNFASAVATDQFTLEMKDMYVYEVSDVSAEMRTYIQDQQSTNYQDGTVTYGEAGSTVFVPDITLAIAGKVADSKAVGDAFNTTNGNVSALSASLGALDGDVDKIESGLTNLLTEKTATLTDLNETAHYFGDSTLAFSSMSSDGVATFLTTAFAESNIYCSNACALGTGKHLVGFKYKLTKVDSSLDNPQQVKIILGASEVYINTDYSYDEWIDFAQITETNLTRVYFAVQGFATNPTSGKFRVDFKDFYIYNLADVDGDLYAYIIDKQNTSYQSGTVTYSNLYISEQITGSFSQINVRNYGVKGDGTTDDTDAIITLFLQKTGNFYFPAGTYKISGTINVPAYSSVYGDGDTTVFSLYANTDLTGYSFRGNDKIYPYIAVTGAHCEIRDIKVIGNTSYETARHAGIAVIDTSECHIHDVTVLNINYDKTKREGQSYNPSGYGIDVTRSSKVYIEHCYVEKCGYECIGIADSSHDCSVRDCITKNGWRTCIQVHRGAYNVDIIGNQMIQEDGEWDACFTLHGLSGDDLVRNLRLEDNTLGASVSPRTRTEEYASVVQLMSYCDGLWFINNRVVDGDRDLYSDSSVSHLYLIGNLFQCDDTSDYRLKIGTANPIIVGNVVENASSGQVQLPGTAVTAGNIGMS